jgi:hairy-and-enhancer-of-split protein
MEKKRRARINHCLNELKSLILDAMKKDVSVHITCVIKVTPAEFFLAPHDHDGHCHPLYILTRLSRV